MSQTRLLSAQSRQMNVLTALYDDPDSPRGGNPQGDVTIVAFLDYNCPFCKKSAPDLARAVKQDSGIRVIYKDWPVLTSTSRFGAQLALASNYQGRYEDAHRALMQVPGFDVPKDKMVEAIRSAGLDMSKIASDTVTHAADIDAAIKRNLAIGDALGFRGTPVYLVGPFQASTLNPAGFKEAVAAARYEIMKKPD
ncbi:DsbA family protein [Aquabacter sp. CN5-332]|uniref:DsbA family protein n=1 Tax=Aquabacter sp. CN5-332 TaxID=3156608 RepID=UPI0032B53940